MPRSKRSKVVPLTKVQKKGKDNKTKLIDELRTEIHQQRYCHILQIEHGSSRVLQEVRCQLKPGRLFAAKNRVMQVALGTTKENSSAENLYKLSGVSFSSSKLSFL